MQKKTAEKSLKKNLLSMSTGSFNITGISSDMVDVIAGIVNRS